MTCKTCKHLDVPLDSLGRRVVRNDKAYACMAPWPAPVVAAECFQYLHPLRHRMYPGHGGGCVAHEPIKKAAK